MKHLYFLFPIFLFITNACTNNQVSIHDLKCEYLTDPLGIDVLYPRLSWKLTSAINGQKQTAYQILVATKPELLNEDDADLWNSSRIQSGHSIHIEYAGKNLKTGMQVYWKVRVWGANEHTSAWSKAAKWEMGLMQSDWQAKWVGSHIPDLEKPGNKNPAYYFRKNIKLSGQTKKARAYISGLGYYELYINGEKVGDHVLSPNHTNYDHRNPASFEEKRVNNMSTRVLYETYDITPYFREGENTVAVCLGNGWFFQNNRDEDLAYNYDTPRFISRFEIEFPDGSKKTIVSDESWKTSMGPIIHNGVYSGEIYDARLEQKGWNTPEFNDREWNHALIVRSPDGKLMAQISPPDRVTKLIHPISVSNPEKDLYRFDLGQMISGWARIRVNGPRGTKIKLNFIEEMGPRYGQSDTYILKGGETEEWEPRFTWHAFRYVDVTSPLPLSIESLDGIVVNTDVSSAGIFQCSNIIFNQINENFIRTQLGNMHGGIPSDCPHRERRGYTGDGQIAAEAAIYNLDMASFYTKWLNDISNAQNSETGYVPNTVPYQSGGGGTAWGSAYILIPWYMYLYYGDIQILEQHYAGMKKWMNFLLQQIDTDGIIIENNLGEWVPPDVTKIPPSFVSTAYYYHNLNLMAEIAGVLNKSSDPKYFIKLAEKTKKAFNNKYLKEENKSYSIGRQGANVFPLGFGMVPEEYEKDVFRSLVTHIEKDTKGHFDTGMMGTPLLLQVLTKYGRADLAYTLMSQRDFPSFGYQIDKGATTIWETWRGDASHSHPMFGSVCQWFYNSLAGINPDPEQPGFKHIIIKPQPVANLKNAKAIYESIHGIIESGWELTGNNMILNVSIPVNTSASVFIPAKEESDVESTAFDEKNQVGITFIGIKDHFAEYRITSGKYKFTSKNAGNLIMESMLTAPRIVPTDTTILFPDTASIELLTDHENASIRYTLNGEEPDINSPIYSEKIKLFKNTTIKARTFKQGLEPGPENTAYFAFIDPEKNGLKYKYYTGSWIKLPDFKILKPSAQGKLYEINLDELHHSKDKFGLVLSGEIYLPKSGEYTFYLSSNDGSKLYINDKLIVDNDGLHGAIEKQGSLWLSMGKHSILIHYFQAGGGYLLEASISGPGMKKNTIPASMLFMSEH